MAEAENQLVAACLPWAEQAPRLRTPTAVLVALQGISRTIDMNVLGAWNLPAYFSFKTNFKLGVNVFLHPDVPPDYYPNYLRHLNLHGRSGLSLRARHASQQFTIAEAQRDDKRRKKVGWVYEFLHSYGIRDGLYCPFRAWGLIYSSDKLLALKPTQRALLACVAHTAINRIEEIVEARKSRKHRPRGILTEREIEVLQQRATVGANAEIAKMLQIDVKTVDNHLANIRRKFKIEDTAICLLEAYKRGLIDY